MRLGVRVKMKSDGRKDGQENRRKEPILVSIHHMHDWILYGTPYRKLSYVC